MPPSRHSSSFLFWRRILWIKIGRMDARHFCAIGGGPGWTPEKSIEIPPPLAYFFTGAKSPKFWYHSCLDSHHFELEDFFFRNLKNWSRINGGRTTWYQLGDLLGPQRIKWLNCYNSAADRPMWLKFCRFRMTAEVNLGTAGRIVPHGGVFSKYVSKAYLRHWSRYRQQIWCVHNTVP